MARACDLLECSSVLEAKLLPKLDFRSQLILASTCHGLRDWLHKLPVANWQKTQDAGVSNNYSATLPSTKAVLEAVRAARACQQAMRTEQQPSQLWAEPLPEPKPNTVQQPAELYLSPDSTLCAVSYCHLSLAAGTGRVDMGGPRTHGLAVYETYTGKQKQILRTADPSGYDLVKWSPCGTQLTVYCEGSQHIDFIDVASGSSNSMPWTPGGSSLTADSVSAPRFSPDGHLFVARRWDSTSAALDVLRVADLSLLASSQLVDLADDDYDTHAVNCYAEWMWHPSSKGLIIAGCSWQLVDPAAFHAAGLSVGHCPEPAHLTGADFSPSGHMLLTPGQEDSRPARRRSGFHKFSQYAVVKCTEQAQAYSFEVVHMIGSTDDDQMLQLQQLLLCQSGAWLS